jgi:outer membrane protein assembly factor BamB
MHVVVTACILMVVCVGGWDGETPVTGSHIEAAADLDQADTPEKMASSPSNDEAETRTSSTIEPTNRSARAERPAIALFDDSHPVILELDREGYRTWVDLIGALEAESYEDALRVIRSTPPDADLGLLPSVKDRELFVPYRTMFGLAMDDYPELGKQMQNTFGPLARLRLMGATRDADAVAVEAVASQYVGTAAAADANRWLADRALATGDFAQAYSRYLRASPRDDATKNDNLRARIRLLGAMVGLEFGQQVASEVTFGEIRMSAEEFEEVVTEQLANRQAEHPVDSATILPSNDVPPAPLPADFGVRRFSVFPAHGREEQDWTAWSLSAAAAERVLFLSNRIDLGAIDMGTGRIMWLQNLVEDRVSPPSWSYLPMRPTLFDKWIYAQLMSREGGSELVCIDRATRDIDWRSRPGRCVASQPLPTRHALVALVVVDVDEAQGVESRMLELQLATFDRLTGSVVHRTPLTKFRNRWQGMLPCRLALLGDTLVATGGGAVLAIDPLGRVCWLRRQPWRQGGVGAHVQQYHGPPLAWGHRLFVFQPGSTAVQCLDLATGRLFWEKQLAGLRRVIGRVHERLIVEANGRLVALDARSGRIAWTYEPQRLTQAYLCGGPGGFAYVDTLHLSSGGWLPTMIWLDPATGNEMARCPLEKPSVLIPHPPHCGPFLMAGERLFLAVSAGPQRREIFELTSVDTDR